MSYRIIEEGRERMHERGGDPKKMKKYFEGVRSMLDEIEDCVEDMCESMYERDDDMYEREPMRERRSMRTGRYMR